MLSRMTLASSRLVFKPHLYMLSRMTLASSRLVFKPHLYMLSRMTLASSRLVFKPHLYMISRMTLASSTFYPSLRGGGGGGGGGGDRQTPSSWPCGPSLAGRFAHLFGPSPACLHFSLFAQGGVPPGFGQGASVTDIQALGGWRSQAVACYLPLDAARARAAASLSAATFPPQPLLGP